MAMDKSELQPHYSRCTKYSSVIVSCYNHHSPHLTAASAHKRTGGCVGSANMTQSDNWELSYKMTTQNHSSFHGKCSTWWRSWMRLWVTGRKVAGSIPHDVAGIFHWLNPSGRTMTLGPNQPLTEMSKGKGKAVPLQAWTGQEGSR
jgi:hypothetical protein